MSQPCTRFQGFRGCQLRRNSLMTMVSSRYETFPMTALEAMAMGCPLVVSEAGGLGEIIQDGRNGLLCRAGDAKALAEKTLRLLKDHALAARIARQAAVDCQTRYNPEWVARQSLDFYRRVLDRSRR